MKGFCNTSRFVTPPQTCHRLLQGFLLPLCSAGDCSLREAVIVAAVLRRVSLPVSYRGLGYFSCMGGQIMMR